MEYIILIQEKKIAYDYFLDKTFLITRLKEAELFKSSGAPFKVGYKDKGWFLRNPVLR